MAPLSADSSYLINDWFQKRNLILPDYFMSKVEIYQDLILSWSKRMNLVSKRDLSNLIERHILDSLVPLPEIPERGSLVDIGSGAGFPAIPLALVRAELQITMLEARHKRALFLKEACKKLGLRFVNLVEARLEEFQAKSRFDLVTARALPGWESLLGDIKRILKPSGRLIYYERPGKCRVIDDF